MLHLRFTQHLDQMRGQLHAVFHTLVLNAKHRTQVLKYLSTILFGNDKRTQLQSDEKKLARDGFMLNVLAVLQRLSIKINLDRVDPKYPFNSNSLVSILKDTKIRFDDTEYKNWISLASKCTLNWHVMPHCRPDSAVYLINPIHLFHPFSRHQQH